MDVVSLASEFPNDNPALHQGTIWVCFEPTAPAQPCRAERVVAEGEAVVRGTEPTAESETTLETSNSAVEPSFEAKGQADEAPPPGEELVVPLEGQTAEAPPVVESEAAPSLEVAASAEAPAGDRALGGDDASTTLDATVPVDEAPATEVDLSLAVAMADGDDAPSTKLVCSVALLEPSGAEATADVAAAGEVTSALEELEEEDGIAIVVEELDPIETSLEGLAELGAGESRDEIVPPLESAVVLAGEGARISERAQASDVAPAEPEPAGVAPVFETIPPEESAAARIDSSALPPAPDDPFTVLVCTLADVAIQAGAPRVAAILPGLLFDGRLPEPLDADLAEALRQAGLLEGNGVAQSFVATASAWRAILRGTSDDFGACGAAMLDEWASDLLARLVGAPASAPTFRQELRTRGVAAFGLVEVAA